MTASPAYHEPVVERPFSIDPVERIPPATAPLRAPMIGRHVRLEPLDPARHAADLFQAGHGRPDEEALWRYLPYGPFADVAAMEIWLAQIAPQADPLFFAVVDPDSGRAMGMVSFLNIAPNAGSIEAGHIWFGFDLQKTPAATEAIYLLMRHAMDEQGFRRFEWKCDAANLPSRAAARRFGLLHEGIFYRATIVRGRNRDTAWYSMTCEEWPRLKRAFEQWLALENFDAAGRQRRSLAACRD